MHKANKLWKSELKRMISVCSNDSKISSMIPIWFLYCKLWVTIFIFVQKIQSGEPMAPENQTCIKYKENYFSIRSFFPIICGHCVHTTKNLIIFDCILIILLCGSSCQKHPFSVGVL